LKDFLLVNDYKINDIVLCFEDRQIDSGGTGSKWFMNGNDTNQKLKSVTANTFYSILNIKETDLNLLIKIQGDIGRKIWITAIRFLMADSVKQKLRFEKLKRLIENE